jgi:beta-glucosidase
MTLLFPKRFLWGAATSSHQVEGGNFNDWSEWEKASSKSKVQSSKLRNRSDYILKNYPNSLQEENYISGRACDHYNRYEEDFDIAKSLNHNAHRLSIEWSRIEPEEGVFNEKEIEHYRNILLALRKRNIEPFVTLWHWTQPIWFAKKGGFENKNAPFYFARYAEKAVSELGDSAKFWITINEPWVVAGHSYLKGMWPPQKKSPRATFRVLRNLIKSHNVAYGKIKNIKPESKIGIAYHMRRFEAYKNKPFNNLLRRLVNYIMNRWFLEKVGEKQDFIGLNYYGRNRFDFNISRPLKIINNENKIITDMGWEIYPEGVYHILKDLKKYNLPVYITENGLADAEDKHRTDFIRDHLHYVHKAIQDGVDVRGYFYWSLLDNFEWDKGFWPRFGLVEVNYKTMERKIRNSAIKYAEICKNNGVNLKPKN